MHLVKKILFIIFFIMPVISYADESYKIKPGDKLLISVWNEDKLERNIFVLPDGDISFPLAGHINTKGLTSSELESVITKKLKEYIDDPLVNVTVTDITGNKIYVLGEVTNPGSLILSSNMDLIQVISTVGGFTPYADKNDIIIIRKDTSVQHIKVNYENLISKKSKEIVYIKSGDTIVVP